MSPDVSDVPNKYIKASRKDAHLEMRASKNPLFVLSTSSSSVKFVTASETSRSLEQP